LAELRGLVKAAPKVEAMPQSEWDHIESQVEGRRDAYCPICMEAFNQGREVLLSCSHMFHQACLSAFEKFMKSDDRCCPICRTARYQKKITRSGSKAYGIICVVKLQARIRGFLSRRKYYTILKSFYRQGRGEQKQREKFYQREMTSIADKMSKDVDERKGELDCMIRYLLSAVPCCAALCCVVLCCLLCCAVLHCAVLCCAVLCCVVLSAVLCCAALRCAVLHCAVLCCTALCCAVLCCAVCCAVLCCAVLCSDVLRCAVCCAVLLCCAVLYSAALCCAALSCAVLRCAVLCCAALWCVCAFLISPSSRHISHLNLTPTLTPTIVLLHLRAQ
jgi:hypothetical protein